MAKLKLKIYRILSRQNSTDIKILFKNVENREKFIPNRTKIEETGYSMQTTEEKTKAIFLKRYDPEIEKMETKEIQRQLKKP